MPTDRPTRIFFSACDSKLAIFFLPYLKVYVGVWSFLPLKDAEFWWFENFNHLALESLGDLTGKHSETIFVWQIASSCFIKFMHLILATTGIVRANINCNWSLGFILFFSHPSQCPPNSSDHRTSRTNMCSVDLPHFQPDQNVRWCFQYYKCMYTMLSSVLWNNSPNRTECPMKFHKVSQTLPSFFLSAPSQSMQIISVRQSWPMQINSDLWKVPYQYMWW